MPVLARSTSHLLPALFIVTAAVGQFAVAASFSADTRPILTPKPGPAPKINAPAVYGCRPGRHFIYRIPCTGTRPIRFEAKDLPFGLVLDGDTGVITGTTIAPPGRHVVTLVATNDSGTDQRPFCLVVGDTLALTPPMGWNSWYSYYYSISQKEMCRQADAMIASGMADYGYEFVSIDDAWEKKEGHPPYRDADGNLIPNEKFPDIQKMVDYIHSKGLKAGTYTAIGPLTCARYAGSYLHEAQDVRQFAAWGFDFLKVDTCSYKWMVPKVTIEALRGPFTRFAQAIKAADRNIVFNACAMNSKQSMDAWLWIPGIGGNTWRTGEDINNVPDRSLPGFYAVAMSNSRHARYAGPGHWNDPDYLIIGYCRDTNRRDLPPTPKPFTADEHYSYMSLWCLMAAPLCFGGDMTQLDAFTLNVLCNAEVIAVDQDELGRQGQVVRQTPDEFVLAKPMKDGSVAVGLFNLGEQPREMAIGWQELGIRGPQMARDLWRQKDFEGSYPSAFKATVARHGVVLVRLRTAAR